MSIGIRFATVSIGSILTLVASVASADESLPDCIEFNRDIRPILSDICFHCHGPDPAQRKANLRFDTEAVAFAELENGRRAIVAGKPELSELIARVTSTDPDLIMPPPESGRKLSLRQIALLKHWVEQGAKWDAHWSFVKPARHKVPHSKSTSGIQSPIDAFVQAKLEQEGLVPSAATDNTTLLRRVTLGLTGLPPTRSEVDDFLVDESPDAFEKVVDRLMASTRYGERMAARWLNAARYADTSGYQSDGERIMWRWRDWVIDAFNANLPFDTFTVEQLAGDLLPAPTLDQRIATGFNRNHRGNAEGGIIPEEFAVEYVVDRVETTATVWLGLTAMCARCHNHKYDPITQKDFYQLFAFFNNLPEKGRALKYGNSPPHLVSPTRDQQITLAQLQSELQLAESAWQSVESQVSAAQSDWEKSDASATLAMETVRNRLVLHYPLDGNAAATISHPIVPVHPSGYLGQTRLLAAPVVIAANSPPETGDPTFADGRFGQALDCNEQHYAAVGDVANFGFFDRFSISAWIRSKDGRGGTIVSRMTDVSHGDGWCVVLERGKLQVHLTKRWLDDACRIETVQPLDCRAWRQITVSYDGSREARGIQIYVDGIPQQSTVLLDELNQSFENKGPLRIGGGNGPDGRFHGFVDEVRIFDRVLSQEEATLLAETTRLSEIAQMPVEQRAASQSAALRYEFVRRAAPNPIVTAWRRLQSERDRMVSFRDELPTTMVMEELPRPRDSYILMRGEYDKRGERVSANVPASLGVLSNGVASDRLALARWLVQPDHPLTARVAVNRLWQMLFGIGIVKTVDDFGLQGESPTHPELLDWLALSFQNNGGNRGWDTKRMLRMMVTSATYRQSSRTSRELQQRDPENRWLARGPRFRLPAEMVRDQALAASGLLVEQLGGPSVKPYQPDGLWRDLAGLEYDQDHGPSLYRRSLYIYWKRTVAPPSMITFDAAGRETCIVKESRTNTPLQALNLMNDVTYVEAARKLGERMLKEGGITPGEQIDCAFRHLISRPPMREELAILIDGYQRHLLHFRSHQLEADALTKQGESPRSPGLDIARLATCATLADLILNLDEAVTLE